MLQAAALGMAIYGLYSIVVGAADVLDLEWWANLWLVVAGAMLLLAGGHFRPRLDAGQPSARYRRTSRPAVY